MTTIPDVNIMRETAEGITSEFRNEFAKSDVFKKMCERIQREANEGKFTTSFDINGSGGWNAMKAACELFRKGGYQTEFNIYSLVVSWGRVYEETEGD